MKKLGVLITNIGTPEACTVPAVRGYLRRFLGDPRVLKLPKVIRTLLLEGFILRTRPKKSCHAYQQIWTEQGSPLNTITQVQAQKLQLYLQTMHIAEEVHVTYGMSYSKPFIHDALELLIAEKKCSHIIVLPLYPQYSASTAASTFDFIARDFKKREFIPHLTFITHYADHPAYIEALRRHIAHFRAQKEDYHLLFSYHGIPEDYAKAGDPYQCFCMLTTDKLTQKLNLEPSAWTMSFQSRLGPRAWLKPYTSDVLQELPKRGIKKILACCPGFASDCLETLEEMAIQNKDIFLQAGGEYYEMIPCLNENDYHIEALGEIIMNHCHSLQ